MPELEPCNKCGNVAGNKHFNESTQIKVEHGYGSKRDGNKIQFRLCDDCLDEIIASFKIKPDIVDDPYAHWEEEANAWKEFS